MSGLTTTFPLSPSGRSVGPHFPTDWATQYVFPFDPEQEVQGIIIPHTAVVLVPVEDDVEYPLTVRDPDTTPPVEANR